MNSRRASARLPPRRRRRSLDPWTRFLRAHSEVNAALERDLIEKHDLKLAWFDVLAQLDAGGGRLRMTELAERILFSASGLTRLVDRLEKAGLVEREPCADDRRGFWARITPTGSARLADAKRTHFRGLHEHFLDRMSAAERAAVDAALAKVLGDEPPA